MLIPVMPPPGQYLNGTPYQAKGRWGTGSGIRFHEGTIQPIGGWTAMQRGNPAGPATVTGRPRTMLPWMSNTTIGWLAIGTHTSVYAYNGGLYDISPVALGAGIPDATTVSGAWGQGLYGVGLYGFGDPTNLTITPATVWQFDAFGQFLVGCRPDDGRLFWWDLVVTTPMVIVPGAPTGNTAVVVTPERFLVALGVGTGRTVQWASQESMTDWTPTALNSAGDFPLSTDGRLVAGRKGRGETLLWTTVDLWGMQYIGGTLVYAFTQRGSGCGAISGQCMAVVDGVAFWMSQQGFYVYAGSVQSLASDVGDYVFANLNRAQASKVTCTTQAAYSEIWWFYPSTNSSENDRYVVYNWKEQHWAVGEGISRTCGVDRGIFPTPILADAAGVTLLHESGWDHAPLVPTLTSGPLELGAGDQVMMVKAIVPDAVTTDNVRAGFTLQFYPDGPVTSTPDYVLTSPTDVRWTARQVTLRITQVQNAGWRLGTMRLDVVPGGER